MIKDNDPVLKIFRNQAWQRAKGELKACLETYFDINGQFDNMNKAVESFIKEVEDNGWQE